MRVVIVGGGRVGLHAAGHLRRELRSDEAEVVVVAGRVGDIDTLDRTVTADPADGSTVELPYDYLVVATGSIRRIRTVPGHTEHAARSEPLDEAAALRDHVLSTLDAADDCTDPDRRRALLSYVVVGGGRAGVEALAELRDLARRATRDHNTVDPADLRWTLVEAGDRILPEVSPDLGARTTALLRGRGVAVRTGTRVESVAGGRVVLSDGTGFAADTVVWTAGLAPHPAIRDSGLPLDDEGRIECDATLRVRGHPEVFAGGYRAAVPDLAAAGPGATCPPSARHAVLQGEHIGANVVAAVRGEPLREYRHRDAGSVVILGPHHGVAEVRGVTLTGLPAWLLHRVHQQATVPAVGRKARILAVRAVRAVAAVVRRRAASPRAPRAARQPSGRGGACGRDLRCRLRHLVAGLTVGRFSCPGRARGGRGRSGRPGGRGRPRPGWPWRCRDHPRSGR